MSEGVEIICVGLSRTGTSSLKAALYGEQEREAKAAKKESSPEPD